MAPAAGLHCLPAAVPWVETSAVGRRWVCACGGPLRPSADSACWWSYAGVLFPAGGSGCLAGVASLVVVPGVVGGGAARQEACAWVVWFVAVQGRRCTPGNGQAAQRFDAPESEHNAHRLATAPCTCTLPGTPSPLRRSRSSTNRQQRAQAHRQLPQGEALPGERNATAPTHNTPPERSPPAAGATAQDTRHRRRAHHPAAQPRATGTTPRTASDEGTNRSEDAQRPRGTRAATATHSGPMTHVSASEPVKGPRPDPSTQAGHAGVRARSAQRPRQRVPAAQPRGKHEEHLHGRKRSAPRHGRQTGKRRGEGRSPESS